MPTPGKPTSHFPKRTVTISALGGLAILALVLSLAPGSEAKPMIKWAAAQPLHAKGSRALFVAGVVQATGLRVESASGCRRLQLSGSDQDTHPFGIVVRSNGKHCARGVVEPGWVRVLACINEHCLDRQLRVSRFRDSDGDGLSNLYERWLQRMKPGAPGGHPSAPGATATDRSCAPGSVNATSADAVRNSVAANHSVCITAAIGDLDLENLGDRPEVVISTEGNGSMGFVNLGGGTTGLTIRGARFRSIELREADRTVLLGNQIGGSPDHPVFDQLIFMPEENNDVTIQDNDLGWTKADDSGNTGYGCRCYGELNGLRFIGNKLHDLGGDGFQGVGGSDVLIDRNEIGPVGANPGSSEHSDNIQIVANGPNLRITNNWIHEQGYYDGKPVGSSGSLYIHGGGSAPLLVENNLFSASQGRTEICGLGTGGNSRSNLTIRNNTWVGSGRAYTGFPGFEWDCDSGAGNTIERNVGIDSDGGFARDGSMTAASISANIWGRPATVTLDGAGNCVSANCNPDGQPPIGFRKPAGVRW